MTTFWLFVSAAFALWMFSAATEELREKSKFFWFLMIFGSAWNAATVAAALL